MINLCQQGLNPETGKEAAVPVLPPLEEMEQAFERRDADYDGIFFVGITSTGVFCRPSCPAKRALPAHRRFFGTAREALFSGFRPCKRCRPMETAGRPPEWVRSLIEQAEADPSRRISDGDLRESGVDPVRVRRYFKANFGMTFQAFCRGLRLGRALEGIRKGESLDGAALDHGYESLSGFRDAFQRAFGVPPGRSADGDCVLLSWIDSPLGPLVAGSTQEGVCLLEFTDRRRLEAQFQTIQKRFKRAVVPGANVHLKDLRRQLSEYFSGNRRAFDLPLLYPGTPFQQQVWDELLKIPYGETRSYQDLALAVGSPGACRAVGTANGMNRIAIVIPCHRVVNKNGDLGGYGGGLWRKQKLLDLEREGAGMADGRTLQPALFGSPEAAGR
jgi:AraC family transcriptional regulator, regulatory protein of adaptative response / methylated-DNA-[protein]-cysteine methyltransferase